MKFKITIEKDDDGRYVAECLDLPGCLSEGETLEEAIENINEAIIGCLKGRASRDTRQVRIRPAAFASTAEHGELDRKFMSFE